MAIAFVSSSGFWDSSHDTPNTIDVTIPAMSNGILVVGLIDYDPTEFTGPTGVSSNQDGAFTQLGSTANQGNVCAQLWYLLNPTAATHTLSFTYSESNINQPTAASVHWWSGVDQTTPFGTLVSNTGSGTTPSVTVTTAAGEFVVAELGFLNNTSITQGADQTSIADNLATAGTNTIASNAAYQDGADGGVMSYTLGASRNWVAVAAPLKPAAAGSGAVSYLDAAGSSANANLAYPISAGTNRRLVGFVSWEDNAGGAHVSSVAVGDQTATLGTEEVSPPHDPVSFWVGVVPFYLTEAQIAAKTGNDIVPTFSTTPDEHFIAARSLENASQAAPAEAATSTETPATPGTLTVAVSAKENGAILATFVSGGGASTPVVWDAPMNARTQDSGASAGASLADDLHTGVDASVDVVATTAGESGNRIALGTVVIEPFAAAATDETGKLLDGAAHGAGVGPRLVGGARLLQRRIERLGSLVPVTAQLQG